MSTATTEQIRVPAPGGAEVVGDLVFPNQVPASGLVLFAHGSGSSRFSPRNMYVADQLRGAGLATLLVDLLTLHEEAVDLQTAHLRFDINLLADRLIATIDWLKNHSSTRDLPIGLFGASTGAAAALAAAAHRPDGVAAVVSRGGRPDLTPEPDLANVRAPVLLIVGGNDDIVLGLNDLALRRLQSPKQMRVVPGATHLFEEPGALEQVAVLARDWFSYSLSPAGRGTG
ncbi:MAG TPA: alpha/beta family hydrolase [Tepidisphaeraceae bacterium]|jgi:dienelactone hydrolase